MIGLKNRKLRYALLRKQSTVNGTIIVRTCVGLEEKFSERCTWLTGQCFHENALYQIVKGYSNFVEEIH